ncbi:MULTISPECIES: flagellar biosynthesis regulator FlaF [unclassified Sphingomonas]|uniref:flagellar biosynthesis regulator FlaF n=1 Tax=unclassified Sphingomonas TaxID=196159 RepID=UPI001F55CB14|nr:MULTISPECIES: flagellar biosynthesis regulator FlaF [unclassified Sphingomonas]
MSVHAYQKARNIIETPRSTEHRLMGQVTGEMIAAAAAGKSGVALAGCLHHNREVWSAFSSACAAPGNELPVALRGQIISIALWVDRHSSAVIGGRETIDALIDVNRSVMDGLAASNDAATAMAANA